MTHVTCRLTSKNRVFGTLRSVIEYGLPFLVSVEKNCVVVCGCSYSPMDGSMALSNGLVAGNSLSGAGWCLFVYNLAPETEESTLWQLFGPFGAVQNVKVGTPPSKLAIFFWHVVTSVLVW